MCDEVEKNILDRLAALLCAVYELPESGSEDFVEQVATRIYDGVQQLKDYRKFREKAEQEGKQVYFVPSLKLEH